MFVSGFFNKQTENRLISYLEETFLLCCKAVLHNIKYKHVVLYNYIHKKMMKYKKNQWNKYYFVLKKLYVEIKILKKRKGNNIIYRVYKTYFGQK